MTITIYVNWECQEIYPTEEELVNGYIEHNCEEKEFRWYLDNSYSSDEIFAFTEHEKEEIKKSYKEYLLRSARDWADHNKMKQKIEI